jgi:hypothetical protein
VTEKTKNKEEIRDDVSISSVIEAWTRAEVMDKGWAFKTDGRGIFHYYELVGYRTDDFRYIVKHPSTHTALVGQWWNEFIETHPELQSRFVFFPTEIWTSTPFLMKLHDSQEIPF